MIRLFYNLSPETIFQRFGRALKTMPPDLLSRYTQIDYDREMALVVFPEGQDDIVAVGRIVTRPNETDADLGITVADAWQNQGLGVLLMKRMLEVARLRGIERIQGVVHRTNRSMLTIAKKYNSQITQLDDGHYMVSTKVRDMLDEAAKR
jgi:acetyltransferase